MIALLAAVAAGGELRPVGEDDTVESIARSLGAPELAATIRGLNGLDPGEQPEIGRLLELPPRPGQVEQRAVLVSVVGDVTLTPPAAGPRPARPFRPLPLGASVCTGEQSFATLQLASACDGGGMIHDQITLLAGTCVHLLSMVASDQSRASVVRVTEGSVAVGEPPDSAGSTVAVQAGPGLVVGAGSYRAHLEPTGSLRAEALRRPLALLGRGRAMDLDEAQGTRLHPDGSFDAPLALLLPGQLRTPAPEAVLLRAVFGWAPVEEALGYVTTIAGDAAGARVLYQAPSAEPVHRPDVLLLPLTGIDGLWWHTAPVDAWGFIGLPSGPRALTVPEIFQP